MHLPQAHCHKTRNIFIFCTTNGWWGLLWLSYIGGTPKHTPFGCNKLTALPERRLMGWTRRSMKNRPLEMRWKRAWGKRNEWSLLNGNEYFPKLCGAEVGEMN